MKIKLRKIKFKKVKVCSKPIKVDFYNKKGEKFTFKATKIYSKPTKVEFYKKLT